MILKRRFEVRRCFLDNIERVMSTDDKESAIDLFFTFKDAQDKHISKHPTTDFSNDLETFCVWDNEELNVVFHEGRFLTTLLLKENVDDD